jgi:GT2 family glycosyltransferase
MIHIAIVSHGHEDLLIANELGGLLRESQKIHLWIKDNCPSSRLKAYCQQQSANAQIHYTAEQAGLGFGANNNFLFSKIKKDIGFQPGDLFVVMNPDIIISPATLFKLAEQMEIDQCALGAPNLFRDQHFQQTDKNIRHFPNLFSLFRMATMRSLSLPYDKSSIQNSTLVDWASGAFLVFDPAHFEALHGFDLRYFMYFEDVDICFRSQQLLGKGIRYYPQFKVTHIAAHKNRNLISRHAIWFFHSYLKFLLRKFSLSQARHILKTTSNY